MVALGLGYAAAPNLYAVTPAQTYAGGEISIEMDTVGGGAPVVTLGGAGGCENVRTAATSGSPDSVPMDEAEGRLAEIGVARKTLRKHGLRGLDQLVATRKVSRSLRTFLGKILGSTL